MLKKKEEKHRRMKAIIFKEESEVFIYELDSQGRHKQKMSRSKRTNYKKLKQIKEEMKAEEQESLESSSEIDCNDSSNYFSSPEPSPEPINVYSSENKYINPLNLNDALNECEISFQMTQVYENIFIDPILDKMPEITNILDMKHFEELNFSKLDQYSEGDNIEEYSSIL